MDEHLRIEAEVNSIETAEEQKTSTDTGVRCTSFRTCDTPGCELRRHHLGNCQCEIGEVGLKRATRCGWNQGEGTVTGSSSKLCNTIGNAMQNGRVVTPPQKKRRVKALPKEDSLFLCDDKSSSSDDDRGYGDGDVDGNDSGSDNGNDLFGGFAKACHRIEFAMAAARCLKQYMKLGGDPKKFKVLYLECGPGMATQVLVSCGLPLCTLHPCNYKVGELDELKATYTDICPMVCDVYDAYNKLHPNAVWFDTMETWLNNINLEEEAKQTWNFDLIPPFWNSEVVAVSLSCRGVKGGPGAFANELQHLLESKGGMLEQGARDYRGRSGRTTMIFALATFQAAVQEPAEHLYLKKVHVPLSKFSGWKGHAKYKKVPLEDGAEAIVGRVTGWWDAEKTHGLINYMNAQENWFTNCDEEYPLSLAEIRQCLVPE